MSHDYSTNTSNMTSGKVLGCYATKMIITIICVQTFTAFGSHILRCTVAYEGIPSPRTAAIVFTWIGTTVDVCKATSMGHAHIQEGVGEIESLSIDEDISHAASEERLRRDLVVVVIKLSWEASKD